MGTSILSCIILHIHYFFRILTIYRHEFYNACDRRTDGYCLCCHCDITIVAHLSPLVQRAEDGAL